MTGVEKGSRVRLEYIGTLEDGSVFDRSEDGKPLEFTVGEGKVFPALEREVEGMEQGERKSFAVTPDKAYGQRDETLIRRFERNLLPSNLAPEKGMILKLYLPSGDAVLATIIALSDRDVVVDLNHPLAGKKLKFDILLSELLSS